MNRLFVLGEKMARRGKGKGEAIFTAENWIVFSYLPLQENREVGTTGKCS